MYYEHTIKDKMFFNPLNEQALLPSVQCEISFITLWVGYDCIDHVYRQIFD